MENDMEVIPEMEKMLNEEFGREGLDGWKKSVYKGTDCGAWLSLDAPDNISVGSIVEGVDECAEIHSFTWPFKMDDVWAALDQIEKDCELIWMNTHGCDDCFPECDEMGYRPVNLNCKTCEGYGISI
jgi:hypothetical protein